MKANLRGSDEGLESKGCGEVLRIVVEGIWCGIPIDDGCGEVRIVVIGGEMIFVVGGSISDVRGDVIDETEGIFGSCFMVGLSDGCLINGLGATAFGIVVGSI